MYNLNWVFEDFDLVPDDDRDMVCVDPFGDEGKPDPYDGEWDLAMTSKACSLLEEGELPF